MAYGAPDREARRNPGRPGRTMEPIGEDTCAEIFSMLDDYVDRELSAEDVTRVRRHLVVCAMCASEFRFEGALLRQLRAKVQRVHAPSGLLASVWKHVAEHSRSAGTS